MNKSNFFLTLLIGVAIIFFSYFFYVYLKSENETIIYDSIPSHTKQSLETKKNLPDLPTPIEKLPSSPPPKKREKESNKLEYPSYYNENDKKFLRDKERFSQPLTPPKATIGVYQD